LASVEAALWASSAPAPLARWPVIWCQRTTANPGIDHLRVAGSRRSGRRFGSL